jgi:hypothetical protein
MYTCRSALHVFGGWIAEAELRHAAWIESLALRSPKTDGGEVKRLERLPPTSTTAMVAHHIRVPYPWTH